MHVNCFLYNIWYLCHITTSSILLLSTTISWKVAGIQGQEMSRRKTSNVCKESSDCPTNANCEKYNGTSSTGRGQCICQHGYIIIFENRHRECYKAASTIGDTCTYNEQCMITLSTESECQNGYCHCQHGAHFVEKKNTCYKSARVGDFCTLTNNCIGDGAVCRSGICHCPYGKHPRFDRMECIYDMKLNEKCKFDEECVTEHTECTENICQCKPNYIPSKDNNRCLKVAKRLHDECEEDNQCTQLLEFTKCDTNKNNTCVCKDGHHEMNYVSILSFGNYGDTDTENNNNNNNYSTHMGISVKFQKCWVSVPLDGICEADENCASNDFAICKNGKCECHDGFKPSQIGGYCSSGLTIDNFNIFMISQRCYLALICIYISYLFF